MDFQEVVGKRRMAVSIGYSDEPPRDFSKRRKPMTELIHRSRWSS